MIYWIRTLIRLFFWKHPNNELKWNSERKPTDSKLKDSVVAHISEHLSMLMSSLPEHQTLLTLTESTWSSCQNWKLWRTCRVRPAVHRKVCSGVSVCLVVFFLPLTRTRSHEPPKLMCYISLSLIPSLFCWVCLCVHICIKVSDHQQVWFWGKGLKASVPLANWLHHRKSAFPTKLNC